MAKRVAAAGLFSLLLACGLMALGVWQVQRLQWKESLLAAITAGLEAAPVDFATAVTMNSSRPPEFTHVSLTGDAVSQKPLFLYGRTLDGAAGVHVLCVVHVGPKPGVPLGLNVLLDRGFLPLPVDEAKATAPVAAPVDGILRAGAPKARFDPPNDPARNQWYWIDPAAIGAATGVKDVGTIYVEALKPTAPNGPIPTGDRLLGNIANNHLQYAITWFSLAAVLLLGYAVWAVQQLRGGKAKETT